MLTNFTYLCIVNTCYIYLNIQRMKKKGHVCDFTGAKNSELVKVFKMLVRNSYPIDLDQIFRQVSESEASRFFISEDRAYELIREYEREGRWSLSNPLRIEMLTEIKHRADRLLTDSPEMSLRDAVCFTVNSKAPKFYLTPRSCRTLIYARLQVAAKKEHITNGK